jgi:hypothetical protein
MVGDDDGNFNPDKQVTRAEMATVMANLLDLGVDNFSGASLSFTDVPEWAVPYVAACAANGIVSGYSDTTFGANDTVTAAQAGLMVMKALGYFQYAGDFGSDWALATVREADKIDLYDDISCSIQTPLTRNDVAQLVLNALEATKVEAKGGISVTGNGITVNTDTTYNYLYKDGDKYLTIGRDDKGAVQLGEDLFDGKLVKDSDGNADDLGRAATTWTYKGDEIGTYADKADYTVVLSDNYTSDSVVDTLEDELNKNNLKKGDSYQVWIQGEQVETGIDEAFQQVAYRGTVVEVYVNSQNSKQVENVVVYGYELAKIDTVSTDLTSDDIKDGATYSITFDGNAGTKNDTEIPGFDANTYVEGAYVAIALSTDNEKVLASAIADTQDVTVSSKKDASNDIKSPNVGATLTAGGTKYYVAVKYDIGVEAMATSGINAGDDYVLYLDPNGYVIGVDGTATSKSLKDVYYVDSIWPDNSTVTGGSQKSTTYAQLVRLTDGTVSVIKLEATARYGYDSKTAGQNDAYYGDEITDSGVVTGYKSNWAGKLVKISDKKWDNGDSNNGKYDLEVWVNEDDYDTVALSADTGYLDVKLSKTEKRDYIGATSFTRNSSTMYLFLEKSGDDLDVTTYTGGVSYKKDDAVTSAIVIKDDNSTLAKYVLIMTGDADKTAEYSEDTLYILAGKAPSIGEDTYTQKVYFNDGTSKEVDIDDGEGLTDGKTDGGFYTYEIKNGIYYLTKIDKLEKFDKSIWDDDEGVLEDVLLVSKLSDDNTVMSVQSDTKNDENTVYFNDIDVSNAKVVDTRTSSNRDNTNKVSINSLTTLNNQIKRDDVASITVQMNISEDGAVIILVTKVEMG